MKYHLITYGCQMNTADSEEMAQPLQARGFTATADPQQADIILMNTCTVRDQAEHRAQSNIGRLKAWKKDNPNRVLIVAGCAASRWGESIKKRYPYIDLVAPATQIEKFPELLEQVMKNRWNWESETTETFDTETRRHGDTEIQHEVITASPRLPVPASDLFGSEATAYVTIMRGCNYSCSYCIVPQVRGREVYRSMPEILVEVKDKAARGQTEVMLLGQTVNSYYYREQTDVFDFSDLLRAVNAIEGVERIRFMSPHPRHMRPRVIEAMRDSAKVCRHIHLPVQSGSNTLLAAMKRLYTRAEYLAIVRSLRQAMPGILVTTDFIVGYPGETDADFEASLSLIREAAFDGLFAFKFSPRPGTSAAGVPDDIPGAIKEARLQAVLALNKKIQRQKRRPQDLLPA